MNDPPPAERKRDDAGSQVRTGRLAAIATIAAAIVAAVGGIIAALIGLGGNSGDDSPAPPPASSGPASSCLRVSLTETSHGGTPIRPGDDLSFAGSIECLPSGHALWLVSQGSSSGSVSFIAKGEPVAVADGNWRVEVKSLGDTSDFGGVRTFFAVDADAACSEQLSAASEHSPRKVGSLPSSCKPLEPRVSIRFVSAPPPS